MSGASVELIGRRPRDYFERLPKPIKMRVVDRIRRAYLGHFPSSGADFAQEGLRAAACIRDGFEIRPGADRRSNPGVVRRS
jgi:hypothetical protein